VRRASKLCPYLSILGDLAFLKDLDAFFLASAYFSALTRLIQGCSTSGL